MAKQNLSIDWSTPDTPAYGSATTPKFEDKLTTADDGGLRPDPVTPLWGHTIDYMDQQAISCTTCDMEFEIPELFQNSSGVREAVYRIYVYSKFRETDCEPDHEPIYEQYDTQIPSMKDVTWTISDNTTIGGPNGDTYTYHSSTSTWINDSTGDEYTMAEIMNLDQKI